MTSFLVNSSSAPLELLAIPVDDEALEVLQPSRCARPARAAVVGRKLWYELAPGFKGATKDIEEASWLVDDAHLVTVAERVESFRGKRYYRAASRDVQIYGGGAPRGGLPRRASGGAFVALSDVAAE